MAAANPVGLRLCVRLVSISHPPGMVVVADPSALWAINAWHCGPAQSILSPTSPRITHDQTCWGSRTLMLVRQLGRGDQAIILSCFTMSDRKKRIPNLDSDDVHCFVALARTGTTLPATARALRANHATVVTVLQARRPRWGGICSTVAYLTQTCRQASQPQPQQSLECRLNFPGELPSIICDTGMGRPR